MLTVKDILIIKALIEEEIVKSEEITDVSSSSLIELYKNSLREIGKELNCIEEQIETECFCT